MFYKGDSMDNLVIIESNINTLLDQLDLAISNQEDEKAFQIGQTIENLLNELNGDTIKLRIMQ
jgi:hypothetical protein